MAERTQKNDTPDPARVTGERLAWGEGPRIDRLDIAHKAEGGYMPMAFEDSSAKAVS
ncbi:hypothetical protein [Zavarzinia sp. CC-PAN008]|uniref:hypothetical protein n=1 Tax=Zavarzinia sp. CC-PAN008 TaxID=3243332 RepID=UPI003F74793F